MKKEKIEVTRIPIPKNTRVEFSEDNGFAVMEFVPEEVELEIGRWYCIKQSQEVMVLIIEKTDNLYGYKAVGFNSWGDWDKWYAMVPKDWQLADMKEVERLLIQEVEKKGYKKGVKIKSPINNDEYVLNNWGYSMNTFRKGDLALGGAHIFNGETGKWAEIVKEPLYINQYGTEFFEGDEFFNVRLIDLNPMRFRSNPKKGDKNWSEALT
ncbi:MAG: hypothetical protein R3243_16485, partial [Arenibacter latericius]|nr:hypothetical protein [Arenibacter latericius]